MSRLIFQTSLCSNRTLGRDALGGRGSWGVWRRHVCDSELHAGLLTARLGQTFSPNEQTASQVTENSRGAVNRKTQVPGKTGRRKRASTLGAAITWPSNRITEHSLSWDGAWRLAGRRNSEPVPSREHVPRPAQGTPRAPQGPARGTEAPHRPREIGEHLLSPGRLLKHRLHAGAAAGRQLPPPEVCRAAQHATSCIACLWLFLLQEHH